LDRRPSESRICELLPSAPTIKSAVTFRPFASSSSPSGVAPVAAELVTISTPARVAAAANALITFWRTMLKSGVAAGLLAVCLGWPCLRVRGPYFVILTLGVSEFVKYIVISTEAALGRQGRLLIGTPSLTVLFEAMLVLAVVSMIVLYMVRSSKLGAGLLAIREDEVAAEAVGVNATALKLLAFTLSALIPGMVGGLMILRSTYFEPLQAFSPTTSFTIVTIAILGGTDEVPGPLLGAVLLVLMSELLWARAPEVYMIILGVLLVAFVLFLPEGLLGRAQRLRGPAKS
jgi:branched-chain amino acid transport system permease protein